MNQKFFANLAGKYLRAFVLLFVLFGAAQQLSAQALATPTVSIARLKTQSTAVSNQLNDNKGTESQIGLQYLRLEYYAIVSDRLSDGATATQDALNKGALVLTERFNKLPNTTVTLTAGHVQTVVSETTALLTN